jgi:hypothetical protein
VVRPMSLMTLEEMEKLQFVAEMEADRWKRFLESFPPEMRREVERAEGQWNLLLLHMHEMSVTLVSGQQGAHARYIAEHVERDAAAWGDMLRIYQRWMERDFAPVRLEVLAST